MKVVRREDDYQPPDIDNPPTGDDSDDLGGGKQLNLLRTGADIDELLNDEPHERIFKVNLSLTLTADNQKPARITLLANDVRSVIVPQLLDMALKSRRNRKLIDAILDNPKPEVF